ncbi:hypothetical protein [Microvirga yunnanensis]|uniref:hypothetical protein n=1 Tax=Microvirga yunnanensis TaxID=2953740 RepID=UPI0021C83F0D|nr:hypothetical protein [Microvirga sp. HBU65207]
MYAVVRKVPMRSIEEAARRAVDGLGPTMKQSPGFIGYYVVRFGDQTGGSITLFETQSAAQEANSKALDWIKANLADLITGEPEVSVGEVLGAVTAEGTTGRASAA